MSSYARYCHDQAAYCAQRERLASSPEVVPYCRGLEFRWLKLAAARDWWPREWRSLRRSRKVPNLIHQGP